MKKPQYIPVSPWRLQLMAIVVALLFAVLTWRVLSLQVLETERGSGFLIAQGEARYLRAAVIPAHRGMISDRRGEPLAISTPVISITADPRELGKVENLAPLAQALGQSEVELRERIERYSDRHFVYLERHMKPERARDVLALKVDGVRGEREYRRFYPAGEVAAHVVGITNVDDGGLEGVELMYDTWLQGTPGSKRVIKDLHGEVVRDIGELKAAMPGKDIVLSIDLRLQYVAHRELQRAIAISGAASGSAVTLDSRTGEVLAMVNHPFYNPNKRSHIRPGETRNRAITDVFEPGSTVKPITIVAALESGLYSPQTVVDTNPGRIRVGRKTLLDPVNYGEIDVATILAKSSQVGIVKVALQLDEQAVWQTFSRFGLGQNPGTGFPGESAGILPYRDQWRPIERVTLAFGYGLTTTPLQLAQAYAVLANRGELTPVSLVRVDQPVQGQPVIDESLSRQLVQMLQGATADTGTARRARVPGYRVAGKTGTTHKVGRQGYAEDRYMALFAGIAPVADPRLVTVVVINEPKGDAYHGGQVAAPVFSKITEAGLRLLNIAPDEFPAAGIAL